MLYCRCDAVQRLMTECQLWFCKLRRLQLVEGGQRGRGGGQNLAQTTCCSCIFPSLQKLGGANHLWPPAPLLWCTPGGVWWMGTRLTQRRANFKLSHRDDTSVPVRLWWVFSSVIIVESVQCSVHLSSSSSSKMQSTGLFIYFFVLTCIFKLCKRRITPTVTHHLNLTTTKKTHQQHNAAN